MKKLSLILSCVVVLMAAATPANAQADPNPAGTIMLSGNLGFKFVKDINNKLRLGPSPSVAIDYVITDAIWKGHLSAGAAIGGYYFGRVPRSEYSTRSELVINIVPRVLYGVNIFDFLEVHLGAELGPCLLFDRTDYHDGYYNAEPAEFKIVLGGILGARYLFDEHFGLGFELRSSDFAPVLALSAMYKF